MTTVSTFVPRIAVLAVLVVARVNPALAQAPSRPVVSDAIAARYLVVVESAGTALPAARAAWQRRIDAAHDTLESVLEWNNRRGQNSSSLRILVALSRFWNGTAFVSAFEQALVAPVRTDSVLRARALNSAAAAAFRIKDQTRTRLWARESIATWAALGDSAGMGRAYERLVQTALRDGDHGVLRALADTGQALCAQAHDADCVAYFLNMRGESARVLQRYDSAALYYDQADTIYRRIAPTFRLDIAHNIGFTLLALGRTADARRRFREGLNFAVASADRPNTAFLLAGVASCDAADGEAATAAQLFGLYDVLLEKTGRVADPADAVEYERYRSRAREKLGPVAFSTAVQVGRKLSPDSVLAALR